MFDRTTNVTIEHTVPKRVEHTYEYESVDSQSSNLIKWGSEVQKSTLIKFCENFKCHLPTPQPNQSLDRSRRLFFYSCEILGLSVRTDISETAMKKLGPNTRKEVVAREWEPVVLDYLLSNSSLQIRWHNDTRTD